MYLDTELTFIKQDEHSVSSLDSSATTVNFIKPYRDPVHKYTWISVSFYEMGDIQIIYVLCMCKFYIFIHVRTQ